MAATGALSSVLDAVQEFVPWCVGVEEAAAYKWQASAIARERARRAAVAFTDRQTASQDGGRGQVMHGCHRGYQARGLGQASGFADRACCCVTTAVVRVVMPPAPAGPTRPSCCCAVITTASRVRRWRRRTRVDELTGRCAGTAAWFDGEHDRPASSALESDPGPSGAGFRP